ncbi:hypothetical protein D3C84_440190 [compost metagenome]
MPLIPGAAPAQLIAVDLDRLGVEALDVEGAADIAHEALDIRQREALAEIGEHILVFTQVINRPQVVQRVVVFERVAGQYRTVAGLDDFPIGDTVGHLAFDPLTAYAATQGPVGDVPRHLPEQRLGGGLDVRPQFKGGAGLGVVQAIDPVLVATLAGALVVIVGPPDDVAGGTADGRQWAVDGSTQAVDILHAVIVRDAGLAPRQVGEEQCIGTAPVAFKQQALAVQVVVDVIEVDGLIMGVGLVVEVQALNGNRFLTVLRVLGVARVLLILVVLQ